MTRFCLSNLFCRLSYNQFMEIGREFKSACEHAFGTKCTPDIKLLSRAKAYTTFMLDPEDQKNLDAKNEEAEILTTSDFSLITKDIWEQAQYVEIKIRPTNKNAGPDYAFGHVEFKGRLPKTATFYAQGGDKTDALARNMRFNHIFMIAGDGFESNGVQSAEAFRTISKQLGASDKNTNEIIRRGNFDL